MSRLRTIDSVEAETRPFADRDRQLVALQLASPKRAPNGRDQADAGHLPLFVAGNEPRLL